MHIPDGMLSVPTVAISGAASAGYVALALRRIRAGFDQRRVVLASVTAALVFALQMLNFPVAAGTSGHFAGGAFAAILLGPLTASVVMTAVLAVQAFVFQDGGVLALGANILNLGVIAPLTGWAVWRFVTGVWAAARPLAAFAAAWCSVVVAALAAGAEIWLSGNARLDLILGAMGAWHAVIGVGEGLITAGIVGYVWKVRPDLLEAGPATTRAGVAGPALTFAALAVAAAGLSFLASSHPDGLEYVYFERGVGRAFEERSLFESPIPDYVFPGVGSEALAGVLAGLAGVIVTGTLIWAGVSGARYRRKD